MRRSRLLSTSVLIAAAVLVASAWGATPTSNRKVYKWVDAQGVTHYGDQIPPEYAAQAHGVINNQGVEVEHTDAQKTPDQVAAEEKKRLDAEQRASRDRNLLTTYSSVQEIERLRDQRLSLIIDQIKLKEQFLETLNAKMSKLKATSSLYKPYSSDPKAPPMTDQLAEDLVRVGSDIHTQEENLREKRTEQTNMNQEFEGDIARFKELKGIH
jgi:PAB1-binding protein PBP1